jgi:hypothetical protein
MVERQETRPRLPFSSRETQLCSSVAHCRDPPGAQVKISRPSPRVIAPSHLGSKNAARRNDTARAPRICRAAYQHAWPWLDKEHCSSQTVNIPSARLAHNNNNCANIHRCVLCERNFSSGTRAPSPSCCESGTWKSQRKKMPFKTYSLERRAIRRREYFKFARAIRPQKFDSESLPSRTDHARPGNNLAQKRNTNQRRTNAGNLESTSSAR